MQPKNLDSDIANQLGASAPFALVELYNSHVTFYMAFRAKGNDITLLAVILTNIFDVLGVLYNAWRFRREANRISPSQVDLRQRPDASGDIDDLNEDAAVMHRDAFQSLPAYRISAQLDNMRESRMTLNVAEYTTTDFSNLTAPKLSTLSTWSLRDSSLHIGSVVENRVNEAILATEAISKKLNMRQLDIESMVKLSRFMNLITTSHPEILFHSSIDYINLNDLFWRTFSSLAICLATSYGIGLYEDYIWGAPCIKAKRETKWWKLVWSQVGSAGVLVVVMDLIVNDGGDISMDIEDSKSISSYPRFNDDPRDQARSLSEFTSEFLFDVAT
ncbi:hypothetical protein HDU76_003909 [Blyttiomyces sp. JEL0837]|nr:hypothetical protein HDU76_003909 [Blyttiomyces sp. JEL0837]